MRNLLFVALLATAALSMGCNGIHKRGGCHGGACGGHGGCPSGACGGGGGHAHAGCEACGDGRFAGGAHGNGGGHGGHFGGGQGQHGMAGVPHHFSREYLGPQGPSSAQVAYPYYTTRGPRDFFANDPMSIGR